MKDLLTYSTHAEVALAAYSDLPIGEPIVANLVRAGMSLTQAARFATSWRVVAQYNDASSGLSATIFSDVGGSTRYLAIRGTEVSDFLRDVIISDGIIAVGYLPDLMPQYNALKVQVASWLANGTLSGSFTVSGHSLGGYLATALMADFPTSVAQAFLYNAPGLNGILGGVTAVVMEAFGITAPIDPTRIANIKAEAGTSLIAGLGGQVSPPIPIVIENQLNNSDRPASYNHSHQVLTDALGIYALYSELAPSLSVEQIGLIVRASSNGAAGTLENAIDALRATLGFASPTEVENREALYTNLYTLQASTAYQNLKGAASVRILATEVSSALAGKAKNDFSYFFALYNGLPIAIEGTAAQAAAPDLYARWSADVAARASGDAVEFTEAWLTDRAAYVGWLLNTNLRDELPRVLSTTTIAENWQMQDWRLGPESNIELTARWSFQPLTPDRMLIFGKETDDAGQLAINGGQYADRLYGMGGADEIHGDAGNDYLEGQAGSDRLEGGAGKDILVGGSGNDTLLGGEQDDVLVGGAGDDVLEGGAGVDTYVVAQGADRITDSDGLGYIKDQKGRLIAGAFVREGEGYVWLADGTVTATRASPLAIRFANGSSVSVENFSDEDFGIWLLDEPPVIVPAEIELGTDDSDSLPGTADSDEIRGLAGNDQIEGSAGDDLLLGDAGQDRVYGGEGGDLVQGGLDADILVGEVGDDRLFGEAETELAAVMEQTADQATGLMGDWLTGGLGRDIVVGNTGNDVLLGGGADDILIGGAGDDYLNGDDNFIATSFDWHVTDYDNPFDRSVGPVQVLDTGPDLGAADVLHGGAGNDHLSGLLGNDVLYGEEGDDVLSGDDEDDTLFGGAGNDRLTGDYGRLAFDSGSGEVKQGNDYLDGGDGADWLQGEKGDDILFGGAGDDTLMGDADYLTDPALHGRDYLNGGAGQDDLRGYGGGDELFGGEGDDRLLGESGNDYLDGGVDSDELLGGDGADLLFGGDGADVLLGETGDDNLEGGTGNDVLAGGAGSDILAGGMGADTLAGGEGDDTYFAADEDIVVDEAGENLVVLEGDVTSENLTLAQQSDAEGHTHLVVSDGSGADVTLVDGFLGRFGRYTLADGTEWTHERLMERADFGPLFLHGSAASDRIAGTREADTLHGEEGDDRITGNAGNDYLAGDAGNDLLDGGAGPDLLTGGAGDDLLQAGEGEDYLFGGAGADRLQGGLGDDVLDGGPENDVLEGGAGRDRYLLSYGMGRDEVLEFGAEESIIALAAGIAFGSINPTREGEDLFLQLGAGGNGLLVEGYYATAQDWTVRDATGQEVKLPTLLEQLARQPAVPATIQEAVDGFVADFTGAYYAALAQDGYVQTRPNLFQRSQTTAHGVFHYSSSVDVVTQTSDAAMIERVTALDDSFPVREEVTLGFENTQFGPGSGGSAWRSSWGVVWAQGNPVMALVDYGRANEAGQPVLVAVGSLGGAVASGGTVQQLSVTEDRSHSQINIERIVAGPSDNLIYGGLSFVDGGAGNDTIRVLENWGPNEPVAENFLYGGAGDDRIYGGAHWDILAGGEGDDYLQGQFGGDTYLVIPQESGTDIVNEVYDDTGSYAGFADDPDDFRDVVEFARGVVLEDLSFSLGQVSHRPWWTSEPVAHDTLDVSWGGSGAVRIVLSQHNDGIGAGIEAMRFADGSLLFPLAGSDGNDRVEGALNGTMAGDLIVGLEGHDWLNGLGGEDYLDGGRGDDLLVGAAGDDVLRGGEGSDDLTGFEGHDLLFGEAGDDWVSDWEGSSYLDGGEGDDTLYADTDPSFLSGGAGDDWVDSWAPHDVVAFNRGDGKDTLYVAQALTISLGGGVVAEDLSLRRDGGDLVLVIGAADSIRLTRRFEADPEAWPQITLQIVGDRVVTFDLGATIERFKALEVSDPGLKQWALADAVAEFELSSWIGQAIGGDLAYRYATTGGTGALSHTHIRAILGVPEFGETAQSFASATRDQVLDGGFGDDNLDGGEGNDTLVGAGGHDLLAGGTGDDTYVFNLGDGVDRIVDSATPGVPNAVVFGPGITPDMITLGVGSLLLHVGADGDAVHLEPFDPGDPFAAHAVDEFRFSDGTVLAYGQLLERGFDIVGSGDSETLGGTALRDRMRGLGGDDVLDAGAGDDALDGGAGNDRLIGGSGSDTYLLAPGSGTDAIDDFDAGGPDSDRLRVSVNPGEVKVSRDASHLAVTIRATGDAVALRWGGGYGIEAVEFPDGTVWDAVTLEDRVNDAPTVANPIADQVVGQDTAFAFTVPRDAFADADAWDALAYSAAATDGSPLPAWLSFDPATRTLSGLADDPLLRYELRISATDREGESVSDVFALSVAPALVVTLQGSVRHDTLQGSAGRDHISGLGGQDRLTGGGGQDFLEGGGQSDFLDGSGGRDVLDGGEGHDTLSGGEGRDLLLGGAGNDTLLGGAGADFLAGGPGNDTLRAGAGDVIALRAGEGRDTLWLDGDGPLTLSLSGIGTGDLRARRVGNDLELSTGEANPRGPKWGGWPWRLARPVSDDGKLVLKDWYSAAQPQISRLEIVGATVETYDFAGAVARRDTAPRWWRPLNEWSLSDALLDAHLSSSGVEALGGELAGCYALGGGLEGLTLNAAQAALADERFGVTAQPLAPPAGLQEGLLKLG